MNIASVRRPIIPPAPPRAPDDMSFFGRLAVIRHNMIATWGQPAYEEDVIKGRFFLRNSFIQNQPDAIRHVLLTNYENYTRTPAGIRMLRPVLGDGLLIAEGHSWTFQRRTLAPAFTPRAHRALRWSRRAPPSCAERDLRWRAQNPWGSATTP